VCLSVCLCGVWSVGAALHGVLSVCGWRVGVLVWAAPAFSGMILACSLCAGVCGRVGVCPCAFGPTGGIKQTPSV